MADKSTFIKLDRNILNWRWYQDSNTVRVFLHLILIANIEDHDFQNITVRRGQLVTSYGHLARDLQLSVQSVRTAIGHLESTGEITRRITNKYQVITIPNYDRYQSKPTGKSTGNQQSANRQSTGNQQQSKNEKNYYFVVEEGKNICVHTPPSRDEVAAYAESQGIQTDIDAFIQYNSAKGWKIGRTKIEDWRPLLLKWTGHDPEAAAPADGPEERGDY